MPAILSANYVAAVTRGARPLPALSVRMSAVDLTYAEVGATQSGDLPAGYRHVRRRADLGPAHAFPPVVAGLRAWGVHRGAGITVRTPAPEPAVGVHFAAGSRRGSAPAVGSLHRRVDP